jgi:hypothetical protein
MSALKTKHSSNKNSKKKREIECELKMVKMLWRNI